MKALVRFAYIGALGVAVGGLLQPGAAVAEEGVAARDILGSMGLIEPSRPTITYRERAPLVIPPKAELRPPVDAGAVASAHAQWPNDPDVRAGRERAAAERAPATQSEVRRMAGSNPRLTVEELRAGTRPGAGIPDGPVVRHGDNSREGYWVSPEVLRSQGRLTDEASVGPGGEPDRRTLIEPPTGYRRSANGEKIKPNGEPVIRQSDAQEASPFAFINRNLFGN